MKIWTVWFTDCFSTTYKSCSVFLLPPKLVEVYEIWIIVWIWAFFFFLSVLTSLGSFYKERLIWATKPNLPFWAHKIYVDLFWEAQINMGSHFFHHLFWLIFFSCFLNLQSEMMIDADLIPLLYNLELISIFPLTEDTE